MSKAQEKERKKKVLLWFHKCEVEACGKWVWSRPGFEFLHCSVGILPCLQASPCFSSSGLSHMWSSVTARNKVLLTRSFSSFTWTSQAWYDIETSCSLTRKKQSSFLTKIKLIEIFRNSFPNYVLEGVFSDPFKQLDHKIPDCILVEYMVLHKTLNS